MLVNQKNETWLSLKGVFGEMSAVFYGGLWLFQGTVRTKEC